MRKLQPGKYVQPIVPEMTQSTEQISQQERSYELLTPLVGGSPDPQVSDPLSVIRATEIRGQLRFWWRACYGGNYATIEEMKTAEDKLWGKAHTKDEKGPAFHETIQLCIIDPACVPKPAFEYNWDEKKRDWRGKADDNIPEYAAFSLQTPTVPDQDKKPIPRLMFTDVTFQLTIQFPTNKLKEIEGAFWAWETFGGLGGRTRRGFGALRQHNQYAEDPAPQAPKDVTEWIQAQCIAFDVSKKAAPGNTPCLAQIASATKKGNTLQSNDKPILGVTPGTGASEAKTVWKDLIKKLKDFRQIPKNSPWPETKTIKKLIEQGCKTISEQTEPIGNFPKAALGLPINFHNAKTNEGWVLQGADEGRERFASPLILRPLYCLNNRYAGIAFVLTNRELPAKNPVLFKIVEDKEDKKVKIGDAQTNVPMNNAEFLQYLGNEADVVLAFMKKNF